MDVLASLACTSLGECDYHRHQIMTDLFLDSFDVIQGYDLRVGVSSDFLRCFLGNVSDEGLCFCNRCFDIQPSLELVFFLEDSPHFWTAVSACVDWKYRQSYRLEQRRHRRMILNNSEEKIGQ